MRPWEKQDETHLVRRVELLGQCCKVRREEDVVVFLLELLSAPESPIKARQRAYRHKLFSEVVRVGCRQATDEGRDLAERLLVLDGGALGNSVEVLHDN